MGLTIVSFSIVGSSLGLAGAGIFAMLTSSSSEEFADYGGSALIATAFGGGFGALAGYGQQQVRIYYGHDHYIRGYGDAQPHIHVYDYDFINDIYRRIYSNEFPFY